MLNKEELLVKKYLSIAFLLVTMMLMTACGSESSSSNESGEGKSYTFSLSHFWPSHHIVHTDVLEALQAELDEASDGRITLDLFPLNQLGNADEQYNLAVDGSADIALSVHGYTPGKFPLTSVGDLPFVAESSEEGSKIMQQLYEEFPEIQQEHADVTPLWLFGGEQVQILSAKKPINTLEDLKGLKVRSPNPLMSEVLQALGAVPISMPMNDVYESLNKGVIDVALAGFSAVNDMKLYEVTEHITVTNLAASSLFVVMNTNAYNSLADSDREILLNAIKDKHIETGQALDRASQDGIDKANEVGITITELSEDELNRWKEAVQPVVEKWIQDMEAQGLPGQAVYDRAIELSSQN